MEKAAAWARYGERRSTPHVSYLRSDLLLHDPRRHERVAPA